MVRKIWFSFALALIQESLLLLLAVCLLKSAPFLLLTLFPLPLHPASQDSVQNQCGHIKLSDDNRRPFSVVLQRMLVEWDN